MTSEWANFAMAAVGAAAALTGLLFVGVTLNLEFILRHPYLPARAGTALATLLGVAMVNLCVLVPQQTATGLGWEVMVVGAVIGALALVTLVSTLRRRGPDEPLAWAVQPFAINITTPLCLIGCSAFLWSGRGLGLLPLPTVCGIVASVWEAWVLMIEIRR